VGVRVLGAVMDLTVSAQPPPGLPPTLPRSTPKTISPAPAMLQQGWSPAPHSSALPGHRPRQEEPVHDGNPQTHTKSLHLSWKVL